MIKDFSHSRRTLINYRLASAIRHCLICDLSNLISEDSDKSYKASIIFPLF